VARGVVLEVVLLLGAGAAIGLMLSAAAVLALGRVAVPAIGFSYRFGIEPVALIAIAGVLAVVGTLAAYVPARRAAMLDPLAALRME
jgi:ABC-type antimicrobial peptide transport system permease subunit